MLASDSLSVQFPCLAPEDLARWT